jgi:hypothetical protein
MKIMAKRATNSVGNVKLPDDQCTQTGVATLKDLFKVHFLDTDTYVNKSLRHSKYSTVEELIKMSMHNTLLKAAVQGALLIYVCGNNDVVVSL